MDNKERLCDLINECKWWGSTTDMACYLIANDVEVLEWIPVAERLPQPIQNPVLAVFFGVVNPAWCYGGLWELPSGLITDKVTHWMPLPNPPKECE